MNIQESELMQAVHTLVAAIDRAGPREIKAARNECHAINHQFMESATRRAIYNRLGYLLRQCK